ncbi:MAG: family 43 glycosylhydrolase [Kiritimatiellae bacterium]|nr:family 43 glycosylhydrolase [Kiritimatiellia bacterium]
MNFKIFVLAAFSAGCALGANYRNPILAMDFSDPDVCRGGDGKFYMTASSFGGLPGLPILVSEDLVNWEYAGYALEKHPFDTRNPEHGNAVWAPSIRYRADKGEYVIYWGDPDRGAYRVSAKNPSGPWSEPRLVVPGRGLIDTCPLYDDDGRIYLVNAWANSRAGMNSVLTVRELDKDETKAISDPVIVYDGVPDGNFTAEGPKFYKKDGEYWIFFPAGGVGEGWQVAARGKTPYGPYEVKTVMAKGSTSINGPHQGGWIDDWFVHFSDRGPYGRIVYLEPLEWRADGWPVIGSDPDGDGCGEPVEEWEMPKLGTVGGQKVYPRLSDEFSGRPGLQWQWLGKSRDFPGYAKADGKYRLYTTSVVGKHPSKRVLDDDSWTGNLWNTPNLMVQKFPGFAFSAEMKAQIDAKEDGEECGLIVQGRSYARLGLRYTGDKSFQIVYTECMDADKGSHDKTEILGKVPAGVISAGIRSVNFKDVWLGVDVSPGAQCSFRYSFDGKSWTRLGKNFTAREGKWIGATVGIYAVEGHVTKDKGWIDVDWFRVERNGK